MSLEDIEEDVAEAVGGTWTWRVETFRRALIAIASAKGEALTRAEVLAILSRLELPAPSTTFAADLLRPAAVVGDARVEGETTVAVAAAAVKAVEDATRKPAEGLAVAAARARVLDVSRLDGVLAVIAPLTRSVSDLEAATSWAVHTAANEATVAAAAQTGDDLVFVAERDACLRCIGHSGEVYPDTLTPPVHPRCRCELQPFRDPSVPAALKREAIRSVLRGFSLPSESEAARLRAARDLLGRGPRAPQSVIDYARRATRGGKFPRGRAVP